MGKVLSVCVSKSTPFPESPSELKLPPDPSTNDITDIPLSTYQLMRTPSPLLKVMEHAQSHPLNKETILNLLTSASNKFIVLSHNELSDDGCECISEKEGCKIYAGDLGTDETLVKCQWIFPFDSQVFLEFLCKDELRKKWDSNIAEIRRVGDLSTDVFVTYMQFKRILAASPREMLIASKIFRKEESWIMVNTSIECETIPIENGIVRSNVSVSGYYLEPLVSNENAQTLVTQIALGDYGLSPVFKKLFRNFLATNFPKYSRAFIRTVRREIEAKK